MGARNCFTFLQPRFTVFFCVFWVAFKKTDSAQLKCSTLASSPRKRIKLYTNDERTYYFATSPRKKSKNTKITNDYCAVVCNMVAEWYQGISARITSVRSSIPLTSAQSPYQEYISSRIYLVLAKNIHKSQIDWRKAEKF